MRKILLIGLAILIGAFLLIQLVPYGRNHTNPPIIAEPPWNSTKTRELAVDACFDCHSNEVVWPWYSNVAPFSWWVQYDVAEGRHELNFSEWHAGQEGHEAAETLREKEMPPRQYLWTHPDARLSDDELAAAGGSIRYRPASWLG